MTFKGTTSSESLGFLQDLAQKLGENILKLYVLDFSVKIFNRFFILFPILYSRFS